MHAHKVTIVAFQAGPCSLVLCSSTVFVVASLNPVRSEASCELVELLGKLPLTDHNIA